MNLNRGILEFKFWLPIFLLSKQFGLCNSQQFLYDTVSTFLDSSVPPRPVDTSLVSVPTEINNNVDQKSIDDAQESFRQLGLAQTQAFIARRSFNTSCAFTIPLFVFTLPTKADHDGSSVDLANQAVYFLFGVLYLTSVFIVPVLFTGIRPGGLTGRDNNENSQGILNQIIKNHPIVTGMSAELIQKIGLDATKCIQKSICESHRYPQNKQYGLLALPLQIFVPPPENGTTLTTAFRFAAREGKYSKKICGNEFRCFFDVMDLATYFVDWYHYSFFSV